MLKTVLVLLITLLFVKNPWSSKGPEPVCDIPSFPDNGFLVMPHRGVNGTISFYCYEGYWYKGTNPLVCQKNGHWTGTFGFCKEVLCPLLGMIAHGNFQYTGLGYKHTVSVTCNEGYIHSKHTSGPLICLSNNKWSAEPGICAEVQCPRLPDPTHGTIEYTGYSYNDTATVHCNEGFKFTNPESTTSTCQGDNRWSLQFDEECEDAGLPFVRKAMARMGIFLRCIQQHGSRNGDDEIVCNIEGLLLWIVLPCVLIIVLSALGGGMLIYCFIRSQRIVASDSLSSSRRQSEGTDIESNTLIDEPVKEELSKMLQL